MKKLIFTLLAIIFSNLNSYSEEIHFDNETYKLKFSAVAPQTQGYGNEYFKENENFSNWTKMIGIYYYPEENNPIKYSQDFANTIENTENSLLLKLIENNKTDKAIISLLVNREENSKKFFEYDVYKFEKSLFGGMIVSKYATKNFFSSDSEIFNIAQEIKKYNDKYLELLIVSQTPKIIEKDVIIEN